jgi:dipeptidase D
VPPDKKSGSGNTLEPGPEQRGLAVAVDAAGNLIIRKPASAGRAHLPGVILQAHLDMVCQNNTDTPHDFSRDPIRPVRRDGWLVAGGTTLGADNGIGVALILAVLEDVSLQPRAARSVVHR